MTKQPVKAVPDADILIGWCIAERYELRELIGRGRNSLVFRARDLARATVLAVKLLFDEAASAEIAGISLRASQIEHPGIGRVFHAGRTEEGISYLIAELQDGRTIAELLEQEQPGTEEIVRIVLAAAEAVGAAHEQAIVHGNLKASNVFVTATGDVRVVDFGRRLHAGVRPSRSGSARLRAMVRLVAGGETPQSDLTGLPTEKDAAERPDPRDDVRALALLLLHMLVPEGDSSTEAEAGRTAVLGRDPQFAPLLDVVLGALSNAMGQRPATANEFARELRAVTALGEEPTARHPAPAHAAVDPVSKSSIHPNFREHHAVEEMIGSGPVVLPVAKNPDECSILSDMPTLRTVRSEATLRLATRSVFLSAPYPVRITEIESHAVDPEAALAADPARPIHTESPSPEIDAVGDPSVRSVQSPTQSVQARGDLESRPRRQRIGRWTALAVMLVTSVLAAYAMIARQGAREKAIADLPSSVPPRDTMHPPSATAPPRVSRVQPPGTIALPRSGASLSAGSTSTGPNRARDVVGKKPSSNPGSGVVAGRSSRYRGSPAARSPSGAGAAPPAIAGRDDLKTPVWR